jgi:hypothetical protein
MNDWDFSFRFIENPWFLWELTQVDYKRFQAYLTFDTILLEKPDKEIKLVLMHELSHIFTIANLRQFSTDEYIKNQLGWKNHAEIVTRMDILNEQMTVRLERILTKFYNNKK